MAIQSCKLRNERTYETPTIFTFFFCFPPLLLFTLSWHWQRWKVRCGDDDGSVSGRRHDNVFPQRTRPGSWRHATSASASPHQPASQLSSPATGRVFLHSRGGFRWRYRIGSMNMAIRRISGWAGWFTFAHQWASLKRPVLEGITPIDHWKSTTLWNLCLQNRVLPLQYTSYFLHIPLHIQN